MPEYHVSGHYPFAIDADDPVAAVDRANDKGGWEWEATEVGKPNAYRAQVQRVIDQLDVLADEDRSVCEAPEIRTMLVALRDEPEGR